MATTTIVMVPGLWEGPAVFDGLRAELARQQVPLEVHVAPLRSTGTTSPGNPSMADDIAAIRAIVEPLVRAGRRLTVLAHSAGGYLSAAAVDGLAVGGPDAGSAGGGVERFFFIAAGVYPVGYMHRLLPFMEIQGDGMVCTNPEQLLFNNDAALAAAWKSRLQPQPARDWSGVVPSAAWDAIPSAYLVCELDQCLPPSRQREMAANAGATVFAAPFGHMAPVTHPEIVAKMLLEYMSKVVVGQGEGT